MKTTVAPHQTSQTHLRAGNFHHFSPPLLRTGQGTKASHSTELHTLARHVSRIQYVTQRTHATGPSHLLLQNSTHLLGNPRVSNQFHLQPHTLGLCQLVGPPPCTDPAQQNHAPTTRTTLPLPNIQQNQSTRLSLLFPPQGQQKWKLTATLVVRAQIRTVSPGRVQVGPQPPAR